MATLKEIDQAVECYTDAGGQDLTLLQCVSGYPAPPEQCNLATIKTLASRYGCPVGWSDHSVREAVIYRAVHRWGASMIEFHLDIDGFGSEYPLGHCWLPKQIGRVIQIIRDAYASDGDGEKKPVPSEMADRDWRTDPTDGLRPFEVIRNRWRKTECNL